MFDLHYKGTIAFVCHLWVMEQAVYDPFPGHRAKEMPRGKEKQNALSSRSLFGDQYIRLEP